MPGAARLSAFLAALSVAAPASAQPVIAFAHPTLDLGVVGATGTWKAALTIENAGDQSLTIDDAQLLDQLAAFTVGGLDALPVAIAPATSLDLPVTFAPGTHLGALTADLSLVTNDPVTPLAVAHLVATSAPAPAPSPPSLTFNTMYVGGISAPLTFELRNTLGVPLDVQGLSLAGTNPNQFNLADDGRPFTLAPGERRTTAVSYQPVSGGSHTASIRIGFASLPAAWVKVTGTTATCDDLVIPPQPVDLGAVDLGVRSQPRSVPLEVRPCAAGFFPLTITDVTSSSPEFTVDISATKKELVRGDVTSFAVTFAPTHVGLRTATVSVFLKGLNTPLLSLPVQGTGVAPSPAPTPPASSGCGLAPRRRAPPWSLFPAAFALALLLRLRRAPRRC